MKKHLLLLLLIPAACLAKEPCPGIKKRVDKTTGYVSFVSPQSPVMVTKWIRKKDTSIYLNFSIRGGTEDVHEEEADVDISRLKGLFVQFSDGSAWQVDSALVRHDLKGGTSVFSYALKLDDHAYRMFCNKPIDKFGLARLTEKNIAHAALIPDFLKCLRR